MQGSGPLDLRETDLADGRFAGADLADADLRHARLVAADLAGANLRGARLCHADLSLADLSGADLRGADFSGADLSGADLREARLDGADLSGAELGWAQVAGTLGLPVELLQRRRADGRLPGEGLARDPLEPAAGLRAWQRGQEAHSQGHFGLAARHYALALRWVPESDAARHALGCVALERGEPEVAKKHWQTLLEQDPGADRARVDLAWLLLAEQKQAVAMQVLAPLAATRGGLDTALAQDQGALEAELRRMAPQSAGSRWHDRGQPQAPAPGEPARDPDDEAWIAGEHEALQALLHRRDLQAQDWHAAIARALRIGALDLAQQAEQRLSRAAPEQHLWGAELQQLDLTAQAFESLVRTRAASLGAVQSVHWVALGVHGPTARIRCEAGIFFAKRYFGAVRPAPSVAFTHRMSQLAADCGLRAPLPLRDRAGEDVLEFDGDWLAIYPDLQGHSIRDEDLDPTTAGEVGACLGAMHTRLAAAAGGPGRPRGGVRAGTRILRHARPSAAWQEAMGQDRTCALHFDQHPRARQLLSLLDCVGRRLQASMPGCAPGLVHGDFAPGNVLHSHGTLAVCDWDLCDTDLLVWDLARTLDRIALRWPQEPGHPVEVRRGIVRALVAGYERERRLTRAEREVLPLLMAASRVDIDASVLPLCVPFEPETLTAVLERALHRLARAAAGAPELQDALDNA